MRIRKYIAMFLVCCMVGLTACGNGAAQGGEAEGEAGRDAGIGGGEAEGIEGGADAEAGEAEVEEAGVPDVTDTIPLQVIDDNYRTYYEVFVYSFYDSDGDGIGDLQGLISRLDYINDGDDGTDDDLGCNGIWLMPVNPSPTYHKYDVTDYYGIDETYGTLEDFKELLAACEERGIKVIMDLVLNHSSSEHPWFQEAAAYLRDLGDEEPDASECPYVEYYNFSREPATGYEKVAGADWYYEARFWSGMPDLNLDSQKLREEIAQICKYWLDMGVGGFRLDAVKEYYTESIPQSVEFLGWLTETVKSEKEDAYLVGEAWMDINSYSQFYASGIDSLFNFAFADAEGLICKTLKGSSTVRYGETVASLEETFGAYNENYIDAPFYTNHDMARSSGYYVGEDAFRQVKMAAAMNLFMNGSAFIYYGEELGMKGSGKDENKRAPMYWSQNADAEGMCDGPADMDDFEMKYESLEEQSQDKDSIWHYYKKAIKIRNQNPEIARGEVEYIKDSSDEHFCILKKTWEGSEVIVIFHTGAESGEIDISGLGVNGNAVTAENICGELLTGEENSTITDGKLTMPGYSVLILR
ncbi:MAG: alpha-amylase family glycosyl hydrolase [Ruminococcus sp.]|nr:alpha-amylase family glycosyl hydrolase [Ruminococcus sp.]